MVDKNKTGYPEDDDSERRKRVLAGTSVLGLLPTIGGAIAGLRPSKQRGAMKAMQRGRGAGATAARQAASEAGRRVAGNLGGRGSQGLVRAGIRSAEEIAQRGAAEAGRVGAIEGMRGTDMLRNEELRRRAVGQQLGAGLGAATGSILSTLVAAEDKPEEEARLPMQAQQAVDAGTMTERTGAEIPRPARTADEEDVRATIEGGERGLARFREAKERAIEGGYTGFDQPPASAAPAVTPEEGMKAAEREYQSYNMRPQELPLMDEGGSLQRTIALIMERIAGVSDHGRG